MLPYFVLHSPEKVFTLLFTTLTHQHILTHSRVWEWATPPPPGLPEPKKSSKDIQEKKKKETKKRENYFGLWARCLKDEFKKKICNNDCYVASSGLVGEEKCHLSRSSEAETALGRLRRREKTQCRSDTHIPADLRLRGSVVTVMAVLQLRANSHTHEPQSRLLPTAGTFRSASCVCISVKGGAVLSHVTIQHTRITNQQ
ncbi:hypothetical protein JOB18_000905 [Xyrichtys novacula]|uniref:Uncharacterized protein n=1 Tax=Xyrichtys novacula TaxID=13765 RepID=A0AAV1HAF3_XYRNO|nr:hypothetical protein JOB18_000905 [Xyrichtys novacula]